MVHHPGFRLRIFLVDIISGPTVYIIFKNLKILVFLVKLHYRHNRCLPFTRLYHGFYLMVMYMYGFLQDPVYLKRHVMRYSFQIYALRVNAIRLPFFRWVTARFAKGPPVILPTIFFIQKKIVRPKTNCISVIIFGVSVFHC